MLKKMLVVISTVVLGVVMLTACGSDPVQDDLINYINNEVSTLVETENTVNSEYSAIMENSETTDVEFAAKLKDVVIPASEELVAKSKAIVPETEEVAAVHNKYVDAVIAQNEAFSLYLEAAENSDGAIADTANEKLAESNKLIEEFLSDLATLKEEHNVEDEK
ncbi:hypothetical protein [Clostridium sp. DL1XJH146]